MPEKTRDRKNWFPRFKSNWLGTYRSKQMFVCCECAVTDAESARYKGAEGKHCVCGRDQWHLAKSVEEAEYNRRMEISKSFGGIRYEEAVERLKGMGASEYAAASSDFDDKRVRCESDESSASTASVHSTDSGDFHLHKRIKTEAHELKLSMGPYGYEAHHAPHYGAKQFPANHPNYTPLNPEIMSYDHLAPPAFGDEESFGELLQGILEDDPRAKMTRAAPYPQYAPMKRFPESTMTLPPPPAHDMEFDFYQAQHAHHHQAQHHAYSYHQPHGFHHQHMVPAVATASFPSAV